MRCQACHLSATPTPHAPFCDDCAADWALSREGRFWERSLVVGEQTHALASWWSDQAFERFEAQTAKGRGWFGGASPVAPPPVVPDWKKRVHARVAAETVGEAEQRVPAAEPSPAPSSEAGTMPPEAMPGSSGPKASAEASLPLA